MKIKLAVVLNYITVLMLILASGTVIFNIKYNSIFIPLWCIVSLLTNFINNGQRIILINNIKEPCVIVCLVLLNTLFWFVEGVQINAVFQLVFYIIGMTLVCSSFTFDEYKRCFINCTAFLVLISVVIFFMVIGGMLPFRAEAINGRIFTLAGLFHVVGWGGYLFSERMSGLFFEPGMYQIILSIAILYVLDNLMGVEQLKREGKSVLKLIVLVIGLILTKSTTGYIVLAMMFGFFFIKKRKTLRGRWLAVLYFCAIPVACFLTYYLLTSDVVTSKFQESNESFSIRLNDLLGGSEIIKKSPVIGWGYNTEPYLDIQREYNITNNSNGLLAYTAMFGIPFTLSMLLCAYGKRKEFNISIFLILSFFVIQNSTESCMFFPALLAFVFKFNKIGIVKNIENTQVG